MNARSRLNDFWMAGLPGGKLFYLPVFVLVNLPTVAMLLVHDNALKEMLPYPGQFLFLGTFFFFAAYYTSKAGHELEKLWRRRTVEDEIHVSKFYPSWAKPGPLRILLIVPGLIIAVADSWNATPAIYSQSAEYGFLIRSLDFVELATVVTCALFLFLWCTILVRIRLDRRLRQLSLEELPRVVPSAAMHAGAALVMFSAYPPLRAYSVHKLEGQNIPDAPLFVAILILVAAVLITFCFLKGKAATTALKFLLTTPAIVAVVGVITSGAFVGRYLDADPPDIRSLVVFVVIIIVVFLLLYNILRGIVNSNTR